jgi:hypothetical protein
MYVNANAVEWSGVVHWMLTVLDNVDGPSIGASRGYH